MNLPWVPVLALPRAQCSREERVCRLLLPEESLKLILPLTGQDGIPSYEPGRSLIRRVKELVECGDNRKSSKS